MVSRHHRDELIKEITDALEPSISPEDCKSRINELLVGFEEQFCVQTGILPPGLNRTFASLASPPATPKQIRDAYLELAYGLKQAALARDSLIRAGEPVALSFSASMLKQEAMRVSNAAERVNVRSVRSDAYPKELCAFYALDLMLEFSPRMPSAAADGPYQKIASLLWELLTGEIDKGLDRQCKDHIKKLRPSRRFWGKPPADEVLVARKNEREFDGRRFGASPKTRRQSPEGQN
jgi:hypothetical protein